MAKLERESGPELLKDSRVQEFRARGGSSSARVWGLRLRENRSVHSQRKCYNAPALMSLSKCLAQASHTICHC